MEKKYTLCECSRVYVLVLVRESVWMYECACVCASVYHSQKKNSLKIKMLCSHLNIHTQYVLYAVSLWTRSLRSLTLRSSTHTLLLVFVPTSYIYVVYTIFISHALTKQLVYTCVLYCCCCCFTFVLGLSLAQSSSHTHTHALFYAVCKPPYCYAHTPHTHIHTCNSHSSML